jgi:hypothetical protein
LLSNGLQDGEDYDDSKIIFDCSPDEESSGFDEGKLIPN